MVHKSIIVAPSILASDFGRLAEEARRAELAGCDWLHLDIMDGHFVDNISFGPGVVGSIRKATSVPFDVHLMISRPDRYFGRFVAAGAQNISVHLEADHDVRETLCAIRDAGCGVGLAINPPTPFESVLPYLDMIDLLLIMTVNPGFGGQEFIEETMDKVSCAVKERQKRALNFHIEVDGGINAQTAAIAKARGANVLVAGTSVFGAPDIAAAIRDLRQ